MNSEMYYEMFVMRKQQKMAARKDVLKRRKKKHTIQVSRKSSMQDIVKESRIPTISDLSVVVDQCNAEGNKENQPCPSPFCKTYFGEQWHVAMQRVMRSRARASSLYTFYEIHKTIMMQIEHPMVSV